MKAIRSKPVRNTALSKGAKRAHVKRKPAKDWAVTLARATFNCVADIHKKLGEVTILRESLAVQVSHVRRLLGEKETLLKRISDLESSQGTIPRTAWNTQHQTWEIVG